MQQMQLLTYQCEGRFRLSCCLVLLTREQNTWIEREVADVMQTPEWRGGEG
jgi:hypothetical protein